MTSRFLVAALLFTAATAARAEEIVALRGDGAIVRFDTVAPGTWTSAHDVLGLSGGEFLVGLDVRPTDGAVFAVGSTSRLYQVDPDTGVAVGVGATTFSPVLDGNDFGVTFDLTGATIRVTSDTGQNLVLDPSSGAAVEVDQKLKYVAGDPNAGQTAGVTACGWRFQQTGSFLYGVDLARRLLVRVDAPVAGSVRTIGSLGTGGLLDGGYSALDFSPDTNVGFFVAALQSETTSRLYTINTTTGAATSVGQLPAFVRGAAVMPSSPPAPPGTRVLALVPPSTICTVTTDKPQTLVRTLHVTGLPLGATLVGIAVRPSNGWLYAITRDALFTIDAIGAAAERVGAGFSQQLPAGPLSCDFDPATGRLRVCGGGTTNLVVDADAGDVVDRDVLAGGLQTDAAFTFAAGDPFAGLGGPNVGALAFAGRTTPLAPSKAYVLETTQALLARLGDAADAPDEARDGRLHSIGALSIDNVPTLSGALGFVATSDRTAYAAVAFGASSALYHVNLKSGAAALVQNIAAPGAVAALSLEPTANPPRVKATKLSAKLDFRKPGKDSITIKGVTPFPSGAIEGKVVTVDVDGDAKTFTLNAKGVGKNLDDTVKLAGADGAGMAWSISWKKEDLVSVLADEGMDGTVFARRSPRQIAVAITYDGKTYRTLVDVAYSVKTPGKTATIVNF